MAKYPNVNAAAKYARDIVNGRIPACEYVRMSCQRHLDDLAKSKDKAYPYRFNKEKAEKVCRFIQLLVHTKGEWAKKPLADRRIKLEPWQIFIHACIYGWERKKDKTRRFRIAYIEVPRKNGKSIIAAGNGIWGFGPDREYGAEVYCGATTEKQAWEVFKPAKLMVKALPDLRERFGIEVMAKKMMLDDGSVFEPIIGDPGDGSSPHIAIVDEYHEHDGPELFDTMITGMGARAQPLALVITTSGSNIMGPCKDLHDDVVKMLNGSITDDELFGIIYTIDKTDDWRDPAALIKANPNIGVSVKYDYLVAQQQRAIRNPRYTNIFKTKHLDVWVNASSAFFNLEHWKACEDRDLRIEDFAGIPAWFSLDLASKLDVCSFIQLFARWEDDGQLHYYCFSRHYLPEETIFDKEQKNDKLYQQWVETEWPNSGGGALKQTDGAEIDFGEIGDEVLELAEEHTVREVPHDPWNCAQLAQDLIEEGLLAIKIPQNVAHLSPGMKELEAAMKAGRFHHDGNPVLTWMISNVVSKADANENHFPRKDKKEQKIDGAVALIMAVYRAMTNEGEEASPYDDPDYDPEEACLD
ncbi:terminase TerL endonuclease subunit [Vibrio sp. SCSIO 43136]|uniref:terminase large subunit n=1 Tax=Vibrio sp. SCSIO 43136 TaxID=2819101 RepID=UPI0020760EE1|nr:terminase TerL endonuclease subunit [Vibrio sp. SCSIO 43136]USD68127.1 terminase large subunit [Vibrio sp. SCSIO 43136]